MKAAEDHAKTKTYEFGEYSLEAESLSLFREKKIVQLPPKTIEVLLALVESGGRVVTREEITERVWAETFVEEANLTNHVSTLRKTLGENDGERKFIETIPRRGYHFIAEVREIAANGAAEITVSERTTTRVIEQEIEIAAPLVEKFVARPTALETPAPSPAMVQKSPIRRRSAALVGEIALVAFAVAGFAFYKFLNPAPLQFEAKTTTRLTSSGRVKRAAISPDGKFIIYSQEEYDARQSLWIQHIGSESSAQIVAPAKIEYHALKIAPNGKSLYYVADQGTLYQMESLGGMAKKIVDGLMLMSKRGNISISPDGKQIAFVRLFEKDKTALLLIKADGTDERTLATFE
jgi:DNA-binding winged helix-turn-helix (wHTH) protein